MADYYTTIVLTDPIPLSEEGKNILLNAALMALEKEATEPEDKEGLTLDGDDFTAKMSDFQQQMFDFGAEVCELNWDEVYGRLHLFSDNNGYGLDYLHPLIESALQQILFIEGIQYVTFAISHTCSKMCPDGFGGGYVRLYADYGIVYPKTIWPDDDEEWLKDLEAACDERI